MFCITAKDANPGLTEKIEKIGNSLERLIIRFEEKTPSTGFNKVTASYFDHGVYIHNCLELTSAVKIAPEGEGPAIISTELLNIAKAEYNKPNRPHESVLVNLYTPSLMKVLEEVNPDLRLINSEQYKWLRCASGHRMADMKPDLFSAHHALVEFLPAYNGAPECAVPRSFGKFINWESRTSIHCIWDAKWQLDFAGFGEKCKYLQIAGEDTVDYDGCPAQLKGVLFDIASFWMINSRGGTISNVVKCKWSQYGSKQLLMEFLSIADPWLLAARALCNDLNVTIVDYTASNLKQSAFLGAGANGRVFKLTNGAVIKIVVGNESGEVEKEYIHMEHYQNNPEIRHLVFPVVARSLHMGAVNDFYYAGYLLQREGTKLMRPVSQSTKSDLANALYGLHSCGVAHGDARIENVLKVDDKLQWIDFRKSQILTNQINRRRDVETLLESVGGSLSSVKEELDEYVNNPTVQGLLAVLN